MSVKIVSTTCKECSYFSDHSGREACEHYARKGNKVLNEYPKECTSFRRKLRSIDSFTLSVSPDSSDHIEDLKGHNHYLELTTICPECRAQLGVICTRCNSTGEEFTQTGEELIKFLKKFFPRFVDQVINE